MRKLSSQLLVIASVLIIAFLTGCSIPLKPAILRDSGFEASPPKTIALLPAADSRLDKEIDVDPQDQIRDLAKRVLERKGYLVRSTDSVVSTAQVTDDDLKTASPEWIKRLPSNERWVMLLVLVDVKTTLTFGSTGNAEVAGALFDKVNGTTIWRDKGIGKVGAGGLLGMAFKGLMDEDAIRFAVFNLMASIPERPKKP